MCVRTRQVGWNMNVSFGDPAHAALLYRWMICAVLGIQNSFSMEALVATKVAYTDHFTMTNINV
jgi:hypothetical protein